MRKWKLKGCPRCGGDVSVSDTEESCLQCGYRDYHLVGKNNIQTSMGNPNHVPEKVGIHYRRKTVL